MRYRISNIDKRKEIGRADTSVIGRIVEFNLYDVRKKMGSGEPVLVKCVTDCVGVPYSKSQNVSMPLKNILSINWFYGKSEIIIEDSEAVYTFIKVGK